MSIFAIGDIHGCAETLAALLDEIAPDPDDHLVFIGDYIDRGPDSRRVIQMLLELREEVHCTFLRGNHESMMLDFLDGRDYALWEMNGGMATMESYREQQDYRIDEHHESFVRDTELFLDHPDYLFVHAGIRPSHTVEENLRLFGEEVFLWERDHLSVKNPPWEKPVVCGHTPQRSPIDRPKLICIDTGCVFHAYPGYGMLTAVRLPEREMIQKRFVG